MVFCVEVNKVYFLVFEVFKDMKFNSMFLCGGFGFCGVLDLFIDEIINKFEIIGFIVVFNNVGIDNLGFGKLLKIKQISKMIVSYIGENKIFEKMYFIGEVEFEFIF